ncbi:hypothetical protein [Pyrodictium abyssi]|uniref:Uncharacterized protein n=1 Tax=Pyrodictium abyssi TaxID=54256 RepID=A0ABN6ZQP2_9CREN|nr:hypothetical protein PABY_21440 [Pyrodictium abyssi]
MPAPAPGLEELFSQIAMAISCALHPVSTLLARAGVSGPGLEGLDTAAYAMLAWLLGSREREGVKKAGFVLAVLLAALALLELSLASG